MNNLSLRQLRYFDALARQLHFGRAAEQCAVTQPALSMQIQEFEREIGIVLVERTRQGAKLTQEGKEIARRVAAILADIRDLTDYAHHGGRLLIGPLRLGVIPTIAPYVLPELLPLLRLGHPELDVHLRETQTRYLLDELTAGQLDVLLLSLPVEHPGIECLELLQDAFVLAAPKARAYPDNAVTALDFIENDRLLLLEEGHCLRGQALGYCGLKQVENIDMLGATSLSTIVQMVANGFGVTLLPAMSIQLEAKHGNLRLLHFEKPEPYRVIGLAWRRSSPRKGDFMELGKLVAAVLSKAPASGNT